MQYRIWVSKEQAKKMFNPERSNMGFLKKSALSGFWDLYEGKDRDDFTFQIQKSSLASEDCIWLGIQGNRAHLTQDMVREILPILKHFVKKGEI